MSIRGVALDDTEELLKKEIDGLSESGESGEWSVSEWTRPVKGAVAVLGRSLKHHVCASACDGSDEGEWLFDVTWLRYDDHDRLTEVSLVLESEWDCSGVESDFQKLVVARANHRVMLFVPISTTNINASQSAAYLLRHAEAMAPHDRADRYLFGYWNESNWRFEWSSYEVFATTK